MTNAIGNTDPTSDQPKPRVYYIKNWNQFQHYKHRNPPWFKFYNNIFQSMEWLQWSDTSRLTALCCMSVASMNEGCVPNDPALIKRICHINWRVDLQPLVKSGFLSESASTTLADASTVQAQLSQYLPTEKRERREETEKKESKNTPSASHDYYFTAGSIKLNQRDFDKWQHSFPQLSLRAELEALAGWSESLGDKWFFAVAAALAKRNREALAKKQNGTATDAKAEARMRGDAW